MIEHYEVSPDWDNEKIRREYSKRQTRQLTYRISTILIAMCCIVGTVYKSEMLIAMSVFMFVFSFVMERHTTFVMQALSKASR